MHERLSDFLKARGISREQLAARTELSVSTLDRLCTGKHRAQPRTIKKLAKALHVPEEKVTGMLQKQRIAMKQPEQLLVLCEALAVCRAIGRRKTQVDLPQAKAAMTSLVLAAKHAIEKCEGLAADPQPPRRLVVKKKAIAAAVARSLNSSIPNAVRDGEVSRFA